MNTQALIETALNIFTICVLLAVLAIVIKHIARTVKWGLRLILTITSSLTNTSSGPNPRAVDRYRGHIAESRNWHGSTDGRLYSEFWLHTEDGLERRYKLRDIHPNLRKSHSVTVYEYAGTLVAINNHSTGVDAWIAPNWLLSSLYPTGTLRRFILWSLTLALAYYFLEPSNPAFQESWLFLVLVTFTLATTWLLIKHLVTSGPRRNERINDLALFCYEATKPD